MVAPVRSRPASSPSAAGAPHESQRVEVEAFAEGTEERRARLHAALKVVAVDVAELTESADLWRAPVRLRLYTPRPRGLPVWTLATLGPSPVHARPVEAPTSRFDSRGCPVHRHPRPRAEEAGRTSSTRLLQLAGVERLPRAKDEIWYQGSETPVAAGG